MSAVALALSSAAVAGVAGGLSYAIFHPRSQWLGVTHHRRRDESASRVALTFDDGPHPQATPRVLEILEKHRVSATFFVIGRCAKEHPHLLRTIARQGHLIANHTMDHPHLGTLRSAGHWVDQLRQANELVHTITGTTPALFRPPMGFRSPMTMLAARRTGMQVVNWSHSARDGVTTTPSAIRRRLTRHTRPGDILLLHDGVNPRLHRQWRPTVDALPGVIESLKASGLSFARVDELLGIPGQLAAGAGQEGMP